MSCPALRIFSGSGYALKSVYTSLAALDVNMSLAHAAMRVSGLFRDLSRLGEPETIIAQESGYCFRTLSQLAPFLAISRSSFA